MSKKVFCKKCEEYNCVSLANFSCFYNEEENYMGDHELEEVYQDGLTVYKCQCGTEFDSYGNELETKFEEDYFLNMITELSEKLEKENKIKNKNDFLMEIKSRTYTLGFYINQYIQTYIKNDR